MAKKMSKAARQRRLLRKWKVARNRLALLTKRLQGGRILRRRKVKHKRSR